MTPEWAAWVDRTYGPYIRLAACRDAAARAVGRTVRAVAVTMGAER